MINKNDGFTRQLSAKKLLELEQMRKDGSDWQTVWNKTYIDEPSEADAFVRLVENEYKVVVKNAAQLQKLTNLKKEADYLDIEETFLQAMELRFYTAIYSLIKSGAKYKDLLNLEPTDFYLPASWETYYGKGSKEIVIKKAIFQELHDLLIVRADSITVAEMLEAPYSVILEAGKIYDNV